MTTRVRRRVRAAGAAVGAGLLLASCGIGEGFVGTPELSDGEVTITFNWWGADARTQLTLQAIELFEEEYPNITVDAQYADWNGYWDRLAITAAAGEMPDVSQFDQLYLASYAERGALLELSRVSEFLDTSALGAEILDSGRADGSLYAVPTGGTANGIIINTTLFDEYGVALPDTESWTWEEFQRVSVELTEASGGEVHGVTPFGADSFSLTVWARQHGGELFDASGDVALDPEILAGYWQRELDLIESGAAPSAGQLSEMHGLPLDQSSVVTGRAAMAFIPAGQFSAYQSAGPDFDYAIADWPTDADTSPGFQYLKPTMYWAASSTTQHPAEAALLIDFLTNDTRVGRLFGVDRGEPGNPAFQEAIAPDLDESGQEALAFTNLIAEEIDDTPPITPPGASDIENLLNRYNQQVLFGESSPDDAARGFINELGDSIRAAS
ncbi:ABC transporter substrate-binding protein [Streptomyces profundus]|uniref:ABC transporter substrate-binding protein n=1 Tax=Streptomyces profundus TaxID=2867410 RepID=UPI001D167FEF|nr:sugar ABC transporter substrate-binding protein [Streptomyces sp. MA3_2.13]UED87417.1 sugar ABC transporter substrate-binding protein [Streptomyces sp. MA3_2.13]